MSANDDFAAALESAGLLQDEYPDDMARRSCTCTPDAVCGAHRLLARYEQLFDAFQLANREKREARKALRDRLDPRNADLARERVGMFLEVNEGTTEVVA